MKKILLILIAAAAALYAMALEPIALPTPWGSTCTLDGNYYTFNGSWAGAGTWYGSVDKSAYDYVYMKYSNATGNISSTVKSYTIQPFAGHGASNDYMPFFISLLKDSPDGITDVTVDSQSTDSHIYNVYGQRVTSEYRGIVIQNGIKRINR